MSHNRVRSIAWRLVVVFSLLASYLPFAISSAQLPVAMAQSTTAITINGASVPVSITVGGQTSRATFTGTSGQILSVGINGTGGPAGSVFVDNPAGTAIANTTVTANTWKDIDLAALAATGPYTIRVTMNASATGTYTLSLSTPATGTGVIDGNTYTGTLNRAGQDARVTFSGTQGKIVHVGWDVTPLGSTSIQVLDPSNAVIGTASSNSKNDIDLAPLAVNGTHTVRLNPPANSSGAFTLTLSSPNYGNLGFNDPEVPFNLTRPGQDARMSFSGTASQVVTLTLNAVGAPSTNIDVFNPSGGSMYSSNVNGSVRVVSLGTLTTTGVYAVVLDPNYATGTYSLSLSSPTTTTLVTSTVSLGVPPPFISSTSFLYTGANAVQTGMVANTIQPQRASVIRGRVIRKDGTALAGAVVTVLNHTEFGQTTSRADGSYDMAVNGGGPATINIVKAGYLSAQRQVKVPWQQFAVVPDVALVLLDASVNVINLSNTGTQVARGSVSTD